MDNELKKIIKNAGILKEEKTISCRSKTGVTIGLVDAFITLSRLIKDMDLSDSDIQEALLDIGDDEDFSYFLDQISKAKNKTQ